MLLNTVLQEAQETPKTEPLAFRLPVEEKGQFIAICEAEGLSAGKVMRLLVRDFVKVYEESKA